MPYRAKDKMLLKSDCVLSPPTHWPGKYSKDNKSGTLLTVPEWHIQEAMKWFNEMKENEKYDGTYFSIKAGCLQAWLRKSFPKTSINESKALLFEIEDKNGDNVTNPVEDNEVNSEDVAGGNTDMVVDFSHGEPEVMEIDPIIQQDSPDMFESDDEEKMDDVVLNRKEKDLCIKQWCEKMFEDLLVNENELPDFVKQSRMYKDKREEFVCHFIDQTFESSSSQEIVCGFTQLPSFVKEHDYLKQKLNHKTREEMSTLRILKNVEDVCKELRKDPSQEAFNQRVLLVASIICPRYGVPKIDETDNVIRAAKKVKKSFCIGEESTLRVSDRKKKKVYPSEVFDMAVESWENDATTIEPNQHSRPQTALKDGNETVPSRLQVLTDDEAYAEFKDKYQEKVREAMKKQCEGIREKYRGKCEGVSKDRIMRTLENKQKMFPSKQWFVQRKPPQTKINNAHTTGLCKDCHSNHLNYERLLKFCKKSCHCKTDKCPNWLCVCGEEPDDCKCNHGCGCDDCMSCKVG